VAPYIKQARKAGETGPVHVSISDPSGYTVTVTSDGGQPSTFANPWDVVSKHATH